MPIEHVRRRSTASCRIPENINLLQVRSTHLFKSIGRRQISSSRLLKTPCFSPRSSPLLTCMKQEQETMNRCIYIGTYLSKVSGSHIASTLSLHFFFNKNPIKNRNPLNKNVRISSFKLASLGSRKTFLFNNFGISSSAWLQRKLGLRKPKKSASKNGPWKSRWKILASHFGLNYICLLKDVCRQYEVLFIFAVQWLARIHVPLFRNGIGSVQSS